MKVHILDDWFDTLRGLPCFAKLDGHDVAVWTDHVEDAAVLVSSPDNPSRSARLRYEHALDADLPPHASSAAANR